MSPGWVGHPINQVKTEYYLRSCASQSRIPQLTLHQDEVVPDGHTCPLSSICAPAASLRRRRLRESRGFMLIKWLKLTIVLLIIAACGVMMSAPSQNVKAQSASTQGPSPKEGSDNLSNQLASALRDVGFTGRIADTLEDRLGRDINSNLANLGRLLWFDTIGGLNNDNTCAGCHSPTNGFGDTQSIAIGIDNNGI